jgi:hypothetical protein
MRRRRVGDPEFFTEAFSANEAFDSVRAGRPLGSNDFVAGLERPPRRQQPGRPKAIEIEGLSKLSP